MRACMLCHEGGSKTKLDVYMYLHDVCMLTLDIVLHESTRLKYAADARLKYAANIRLKYAARINYAAYYKA